MKRWLIPVFMVAVVAVGVGAFFGGRATAEDSAQPAAEQRLPGLPGADQRQGGDMITGTVIAVDSSGITVKSTDGGSHIILVSGSTTISRTEAAILDDLAVGENVVVSGTGNDDGTVSATRIQVGATLPFGQGALPQETPASVPGATGAENTTSQ